MENDILDSIDDLGYSESVSEDDLDEITKDGPPELKFTKLVSWYDVLHFFHLSERVHDCFFVRPSVGWSVGPSVTLSLKCMKSLRHRVLYSSVSIQI